MAYSPAPLSPSPVRPVWIGGLILLGVMIGLMWVEEIVDAVLQGSLDGYGIRARDTDGLGGIVFAPFLHAGFNHLMANTIPLAVLGAMIALSGALRLFVVTLIVGVVSGLGAWLTSPPNSVTVGASGLVFGFAAYLVMRGIFNRKLAQLALGLVVIAVWGTALLGGLVPQNGISWQGHLFGAVGGVLAAWLLASRSGPKTPKAADGLT